MSATVLDKELAALDEQIGRVRREQEQLEQELRAAEAELEGESADRQRFDALQEVYAALDRLRQMKADGLFWDGIAEPGRAASHLDQARGRIARHQEKTGALLERQAALRKEIDRCRGELAFLQDEVREAYDREERRDAEYVIVREISPLPQETPSREAVSDRQFRRALLVALLAAVVFGTLFPLLKVPEPERPVVTVVPERLVSMLRREKPEPPPPPEEKKEEQAAEEKAKEEKTPKEERPKAEPTPEQQAARKRAERTGVLAFRESFKDLIEEAPPARLGAEARLAGQPAAAAPRAGRSLVALPSSGAGSSGGIGGAGISRSIGPGTAERVSGVDVAKVESKVTRLEEEVRPAAAGAGAAPARTDEEIQLVFDRYKATLYRMYNTELRRNPALRGRIVLRITIEPGGEVSACTVQTTDLASKELVDQIVARVLRFQFGPLEKGSRTTILYPIDFLPGG